jgi:drug/metabolite transporter (DMT)-like permease
MSSVTAAVGQILLKLGAEGRHQLTDFINAFIVGGLLFYGVGTAIWIYVLSSEKLMNVFAFTALTFVFVYVGSILIDGNGTTSAGLIGILLVLSGLYLLSQHNV